MSGRKFPLEVVLRVREIRERMARSGVARARSSEAEAEKRLIEGRRTLSAHHSPTAADASTFAASFLARQSLASQVQALQGLVDVRVGETAEAIAEWQDREQDRAGVDRLREEHAAEVAAADLADAQQEIDDVAGRPHRPLGGDER